MACTKLELKLIRKYANNSLAFHKSISTISIKVAVSIGGLSTISTSLAPGIMVTWTPIGPGGPGGKGGGQLRKSRGGPGGKGNATGRLRKSLGGPA
jgi:hypothetical protein